MLGGAEKSLDNAMPGDSNTGTPDFVNKGEKWLNNKIQSISLGLQQQYGKHVIHTPNGVIVTVTQRQPHAIDIVGMIKNALFYGEVPTKKCNILPYWMGKQLMQPGKQCDPRWEPVPKKLNLMIDPPNTHKNMHPVIFLETDRPITLPETNLMHITQQRHVTSFLEATPEDTVVDSWSSSLWSHISPVAKYVTSFYTYEPNPRPEEKNIIFPSQHRCPQVAQKPKAADESAGWSLADQMTEDLPDLHQKHSSQGHALPFYAEIQPQVWGDQGTPMDDDPYLVNLLHRW